MNDMDKLQKIVNDWQMKTFPKSTPTSKLHHLKKEIKELEDLILRGQDIGEELADVQLLLFGIASLNKKSCYKEAVKKLKINKKRKWGEPDENGVVEHVR